MLVGKKCKVGNKTKIDADNFSFYEGVIASEPQMQMGDDYYFFVVVQNEGRLIIVDTDYIYDIDAL